MMKSSREIKVLGGGGEGEGRRWVRNNASSNRNSLSSNLDLLLVMIVLMMSCFICSGFSNANSVIRRTTTAETNVGHSTSNSFRTSLPMSSSSSQESTISSSTSTTEKLSVDDEDFSVSSTPTTSTTTSQDDKYERNWLLPNESFRDTKATVDERSIASSSSELSVVTLNVLAPSLYGLDPNIDESNDRQTRYVDSIMKGIQTNADILCFQEVEGGVATQHEILLKSILNKHNYDYIWKPLHPKRADIECVGLCIAWKRETTTTTTNNDNDDAENATNISSNRFSVVECRSFARGMILQLEQSIDGTRFVIGNVHLTARPSNINGRLRTIHNVIRNINMLCDTSITNKHIPLDGSIIVCGDFNGDESSAALRLLQNGYIKHGSILDRNYRYKLTKSDSSKLKHHYKFYNLYAGLKPSTQHLTVSLHGRGPGIMDHILLSSSSLLQPSQLSKQGQKQLQGKGYHKVDSDILSLQVGGVRQKRRLRRKLSNAEASTKIDEILNSKSSNKNTDGDKSLINNRNNNRLIVESRLATLDGNTTRTQIIESGIPVMPDFPSDHLPIGALFVPCKPIQPINENSFETKQQQDEQSSIKESSIELDAYNTRQRHDTLLRCVVSWLVSTMGVSSQHIIQDKPLYQWKWTQGLRKQNQQDKGRGGGGSGRSKGREKSHRLLTNKMRAPDICFTYENKLIMIEVTAVRMNRTKRVTRQKQLKYRDLAQALSHSPSVQEASLKVVEPYVIVVPDVGPTLPPDTVDTIHSLAIELKEAGTARGSGKYSKKVEEETDDAATKQLTFDLLRVRNHWS